MGRKNKKNVERIRGRQREKGGIDVGRETEMKKRKTERKAKEREFF